MASSDGDDPAEDCAYKTVMTFKIHVVNGKQTQKRERLDLRRCRNRPGVEQQVTDPATNKPVWVPYDGSDDGMDRSHLFMGFNLKDAIQEGPNLATVKRMLLQDDVDQRTPPKRPEQKKQKWMDDYKVDVI